MLVVVLPRQLRRRPGAGRRPPGSGPCARGGRRSRPPGRARPRRACTSRRCGSSQSVEGRRPAPPGEIGVPGEEPGQRRHQRLGRLLGHEVAPAGTRVAVSRAAHGRQTSAASPSWSSSAPTATSSGASIRRPRPGPRHRGGGRCGRRRGSRRRWRRSPPGVSAARSARRAASSHGLGTARPGVEGVVDQRRGVGADQALRERRRLGQQEPGPVAERRARRHAPRTGRGWAPRSRPPRPCPRRVVERHPVGDPGAPVVPHHGETLVAQLRITPTSSAAISRLVCPRRAVARGRSTPRSPAGRRPTTRRPPAARPGATWRQHTCVWGKPCSSRTGGPAPPWRDVVRGLAGGDPGVGEAGEGHGRRSSARADGALTTGVRRPGRGDGTRCGRRPRCRATRDQDHVALPRRLGGPPGGADRLAHVGDRPRRRRPRASASLATSAGGTARGDGRGGGDHPVAGADAEAVQHVAEVPAREHPQHEVAGARHLELLGQRGGRGPGAVGVVGAVEDHERRPVQHLEAAGQPQPGRSASATTSGSSGRPKNASTAATATAGLSAWWAPWTGRKTSSSRPCGVRRSTRWPPSAWRSATHAEVVVAHPGGGGSLGREHRAQGGVGLAQHQVAAGLDDAGLLRRHPPAPVADAVGVVLARRW